MPQSKYIKPSRIFTCTCAIICFFIMRVPCFAAEGLFDELAFERMWPQMSQSWYFNAPLDVAVDKDGYIYVADTGNFRIQKFSAAGSLVSSWGTRGSGNGEFVNPWAIAYHPDGYIYVSDTGYYEPTEEQVSRIQKFTLSGKWVSKIGEWGSGNGQFNDPKGIAVDKKGNVYVADSGNNRIQMFTSGNEFVRTWPVEVADTWEYAETADVELDPDGNLVVLIDGNMDNPGNELIYPIQIFTPEGVLLEKWPMDPEDYNGRYAVSVDAENRIYISEIWGHHIKVYSKDGTELTTLGGYGTSDGKFNSLSGITIGPSGNLYIADTDNHRIQKIDTSGDFIFNMGNAGTGRGEFVNPRRVTAGIDGKIYVADASNNRVQVFDKTGKFSLEIDMDMYVTSVAVDSQGSIYTTHPWNSSIRKYSANGGYIDEWSAAGAFQFKTPVDIAVDSNDNLYVADDTNATIYKLTSNGSLITQWGSLGKDDGQFTEITSVAAGPSGSVYVADYGWYEPEVPDCEEALTDSSETCGEEVAKIQKFDSSGTYISQWGVRGSQSGQFINPMDVAVDSQGNVYVADTGNYRIQKFTSDGSFVKAAGRLGTEPGTFTKLTGLTFDDQGNFYTVEEGSNRVQVFSKTSSDITPAGDPKAIIVAGGGDYAGNTLWNATQICTNYAYRVLTYQGYSKENIYYLSSDADLDLDGNGVFDDVDLDATGTNLKQAITDWAKDADDLVIYITDHGGDKTFRISGTELISASELDSWLDQVETVISGKVSLIYDACQSGSFLSEMTPNSGKSRIVLASAKADESAYFTSQGSLSFSYLFWGNIFNGMSIGDAFYAAQNAISYTYTNQTPVLDDSNNGVGNEIDDGIIAADTYIGNAVVSAADIPLIGSVSQDQTITDNGTSATLTASNVTDANGISRVWAVITPPGSMSPDPSQPVLSLPVLDMAAKGGSSYEGTYENFFDKGIYNIAVYASDNYGIISFPVKTSVTQTISDKIDITGFTVTGETMVNTPVTLTVNAESSLDSKLYYRFSVHPDYGTPAYDGLSWTSMTDTEWIADNFVDYSFSKKGKYIVVVWVTNDPETVSAAGIPILGYSLDIEDSTCKTNLVASSISGTYTSGNPVSFSVNASSECSKNLFYRFSYHPDYGTSGYNGLNWNSMTDSEWVSSNSINHTFLQSGKYIVVVWVTEDPDSYEPDGIPIAGWSVEVE